MPSIYCLVCGCSMFDLEVKKMHFFPKDLERSKIWQENMGVVYITGESLYTRRICSRHFEDKWYLNSKLSKNAVPTLFSAYPKKMVAENYAVKGGSSIDGYQVKEECFLDDYKMKNECLDDGYDIKIKKECSDDGYDT